MFGILALVLVQGQAKPMCDPDNGGLKLPAGTLKPTGMPETIVTGLPNDLWRVMYTGR
jgi:hypothetical protein